MFSVAVGFTRSLANSVLFFFFKGSAAPRDLHSSPTRRSSDPRAHPLRLPADLRRQIEAAGEGAPVQLYALADLAQALRLVESWVASASSCTGAPSQAASI